ncbi:RNA polymerase sigma-70 factor [Catalinimonas sp. 4WD22]|uniref:RNA polymerase sigma factor n=1 Tax=Catalinimonas locisalis TaxID=3133978 RepID=UPI003101916C
MSVITKNIDQTLIKQMIEGDENAFKKVYDLYYSKLFFYCLQFVKSEDLARELLQDVFVKLWTRRENINPELSLNAYLYTITRNHTLDFLKNAARDQQLKEEIIYSVATTHNQVEDQMSYAEYIALANQVIQKLPAQRKLIFQLSRHDGMSYEEIATTLSISKNTVKVQMLRALNTIRKYLKIHTDLTVGIVICLTYLFHDLI